VNDISLQANDTGGHGGQSLLFNVIPPTIPVITSSNSALACVGQPFSYQILASNGPTSFGATNLAPGLSINTSTGLISGIPTTSGNSTIGISASNGSGTGTKSLTFVVLSDADGDGIGDDWELTYGLDPSNASDALLDKDGDGQSNRAEWLAGTAPDNAAMSLRITNEQIVGADVVITWSAVAGKRYSVVSRTALASPTWTELTPAPIVATANTASFTHISGKSGASTRFYRVEVVP